MFGAAAGTAGAQPEAVRPREEAAGLDQGALRLAPAGRSVGDQVGTSQVSCLVCGSPGHLFETCPLVPAGWWSDALPEQTVRAAIFRAEASFPKDLAIVRACAGDGDCLFTAVGTEALRVTPGFASSLNIVDVGPSMRALFLVSIVKADAASELVSGVHVRLLIESSSGLPWNQYLRMMQCPSATNKASWGGFAEIAFLAHMLRLRIEVYEFHLETIRRIMAVGRDDMPVAKVVWNGIHYNPVGIAEEL